MTVDPNSGELKAGRAEPPGLTLPSHPSSKAVVTCKDAAAARGIPLTNELKSIVLEANKEVVVVHVPGDKYVSLRAVKRTLGLTQAHLASPEMLSELVLTPGTVCAVLEPVWSLRHLISEEVFQLSYVSTNDGTLNGYFVFPPDLLLLAEHVQIGEFSRSGEVQLSAESMSSQSKPDLPGVRND
jgi:prolyl-tRNA editing enzyme YbaK/EbsC (Cys-tRNA(Pro) deacylase)